MESQTGECFSPDAKNLQEFFFFFVMTIDKMNNGFEFSSDYSEVLVRWSRWEVVERFKMFKKFLQASQLGITQELFSFSYFRSINSTCMQICRSEQNFPNILHLCRPIFSELIMHSMKKKWAKKNVQSIRLILCRQQSQSRWSK